MTTAEARELLELTRAIAAKLGVNVRTTRAEERGGDEPELERDDLPIAADDELDRPGGDPVVRCAMPRAWQGHDFRGKRMSQCPPRLLGQLAHLLAWKADRNRAEGKDRFALEDARNAALARGHRRRLEAQQGEPADGVDFSAADSSVDEPARDEPWF